MSTFYKSLSDTQTLLLNNYTIKPIMKTAPTNLQNLIDFYGQAQRYAGLLYYDQKVRNTGQKSLSLESTVLQEVFKKYNISLPSCDIEEIKEFFNSCYDIQSRNAKGEQIIGYYESIWNTYKELLYFLDDQNYERSKKNWDSLNKDSDYWQNVWVKQEDELKERLGFTVRDNERIYLYNEIKYLADVFWETLNKIREVVKQCCPDVYNENLELLYQLSFRIDGRITWKSTERIISSNQEGQTQSLQNPSTNLGAEHQQAIDRNIKITWQGEKKVLINALRQMKTAHNNKGQTLIKESYEDIAQFLILHVNGFENNKISTLSKQLSKNLDDPKGNFLSLDLTSSD